MLRVAVAAVEFGAVIPGPVVPEGVPGPGMAAALNALEVGALSDTELVEVMVAWRRLTSWAQSCELAAVAELVRRREARHHSGPAVRVGEFIADEDRQGGRRQRHQQPGDLRGDPETSVVTESMLFTPDERAGHRYRTSYRLALTFPGCGSGAPQACARVVRAPW
jgi:hypothetical protein